MVRVEEIGLRATIVKTRDDHDVILPNFKLVQNRVTNYTYRDPVARICTFVGVSYSSDLKKVREVLEQSASALPGRDDSHAAQVLLLEFGASSVNYRVCVWSDDPWNMAPMKSQLNEAIWCGLKKAGIVIAFPQLDVHFDKDVKS